MKDVKNNPVIVPLEFKVACMISKIDVQEVLQIFVDYVLLYDTLNDVYSAGYTECTKTTSSYVLSREDNSEPSKSFEKCNDIAVACILMIVNFIKKAPNSVVKNRKKVKPLIAKLFTAMERVYAPNNRIYVENSPIDLNKDFCILCEMHGCSPNEYLEYFMNHISMADFHAREALKLYVQNLSLASFLLIVNTLRNDKKALFTVDPLEMEFYQKAQELRLSLFNVRDLEERTKILRDYYLSHYYLTHPK